MRAGGCARSATAAMAGCRESWMQIEITREPDPAGLPRLTQALSGVLADVRAAVADWQPMRQTLRAVLDELPGPPAPPVPRHELAEVQDFLRWLDDDNFTFLGYREYDFDGAAEPDAAGARHPRRSRLSDLRRIARFVVVAARRAGFRPPARASCRHQVEPPRHRPSRGAYGRDRRAPVRREWRGRRDSPVSRAVHLARLQPQSARDPAVAAQGPPHRRALRVVARQPRRQGAGAYSRHPAARRAVPGRRRRAVRYRRSAFSICRNASASRCSCAATRSSALSRASSSRRANATTATCAGGSRRSSNEAFAGRLSAFYTHLDDSVLARIQFIIRTTRGAVPAVDVGGARTSNSPRPAAAGRTISRRRRRPPSARPKRARGCAASKPFPVAYQALTQPIQAIADLPRIEKVLAGSPLEVSLHPIARERANRVAALPRQGPGRAVRRAADARKSRAARRRRRAVPHRQHRRQRGLGPRIPARRRSRRRRGFRCGQSGGSRKLWRRYGPAASKTTASTASSSRRGLSARQVSVLRLYAKVLRQAGSAFSQAYMEDTLGAHPDIAARLGKAVRDPLRSRRAGRPRACRHRRGAGDRPRARRGREPRRRPHPAQLFDPDPQDRAHELLSAVAVGRAQTLSRGQARQQRDRSAAAAAPAVRDLRLQPAGRRRAHARRQGRARRHPLVRPQGGFPHRDPRADEGADGQERGHRPGRVEGRVRRQTAARGARPARRRSGRMLQDPDPRPARPDRQHRRRRRRRPPHRAARQCRPPRRRRPLSRRRRRQGHRDLLRLRQRDLRGIRLLARRRLCLGRLGRLRPQGDGHHRARRLGTRQTPFPRARARHRDERSDRRRGRRHVGRRVRQRHADVAPSAAARRLRPSPRLCRSRPRPGAQLRRAPAAVPPAAIELGRLRPGADLRGRRRLRARRQIGPDQPADEARFSASRPTG